MNQSSSYIKTISHRRERVIALLTKGLKGFQFANDLVVRFCYY
jgi:hypothetical protein